jgi:hypothetical protein
MNLSNTAKDVIRVATTAGLSKDVIDLLTAKVSLLDEKLDHASIRVSELEAENKDLRSKIKDKPSVACEAAPILEALHVDGPLLTIREICEATGIASDEVEHMWTGGLVTNGFVEILKDDTGCLVSMTILDAGREAWIKHRKFMETVE